MNDTQIVSLGFILAGALAFYFGYMIRYRGKVSWLAGYDAADVRDSAGLGQFSGSWLMLLGVLQIASGLLMLVSFVVAISLFVLSTLGVVGRIISGKSAFMR